MRILFFVILTFCACSSYQVTPYQQAEKSVKSSVSEVEILLSNPERRFSKVGMISTVTAVFIGMPTITDAHQDLKAAGKELGADAVIVRGKTVMGNKITVEAEGIVWR